MSPYLNRPLRTLEEFDAITYQRNSCGIHHSPNGGRCRKCNAPRPHGNGEGGIAAIIGETIDSYNRVFVS